MIKLFSHVSIFLTPESLLEFGLCDWPEFYQRIHRRFHEQTASVPIATCNSGYQKVNGFGRLEFGKYICDAGPIIELMSGEYNICRFSDRLVIQRLEGVD
jgi:hypothetical protein